MIITTYENNVSLGVFRVLGSSADQITANKKSKVKKFYCCFFLGTLYKRMYLYTSQELRVLSRSLKSFSRLFHEILHDGTTSDAQRYELKRSRPIVMLKLIIFVTLNKMETNFATMHIVIKIEEWEIVLLE